MNSYLNKNNTDRQKMLEFFGMLRSNCSVRVDFENKEQLKKYR